MIVEMIHSSYMYRKR